jgi:NitT/TauT family transport system substrate-binding protein
VPNRVIRGYKIPLMKTLRPVFTVLLLALAFNTTRAAAAIANTPFKLTIQLDWVAEPEHGGIYQAQARGFFAAEGLDVTIVPGGPNAFVPQKVATNQAQLGQGDSTDILQKIAVGLPLLSVAAVFQDDPSGLLVNPASSVRRFEDLDGKTIIARPEWTFLAFLKKKYGVSVNVIPQSFSVAAFLGDKEAIQQGYFIAEPYHIVKAGGAKPRFLSTWDAGFRAYAVIFTNRKFAREHPAELRAFMRAYVKGWSDYLTGDPTLAHAAMKKANPNLDDAFALASRQLILDEKLVTGRDADGGPANIGRLNATRFATQISQLEDLGVLPKGKVTPAQAMTTEFLP